MEPRAIKGNLRGKACSYFAFLQKFMGLANTFPTLRAPVKISAGRKSSGERERAGLL